VLAGRILAPNDTPRVLNSMVKFTREIGLTADSTIDTSPATKGRP
jgi:hypothetical protein